MQEYVGFDESFGLKIENKVGLIGLVEVEWLETLNKVSLDDIIYEDYVTG